MTIINFDNFNLQLSNISLSGGPISIAGGDVCHLFGLSGSGVTEFLLLASGLLNMRGITSPAAKNHLVRTTQFIPNDQLAFVELQEKPLYSYSNGERSRLIGFIFENPELFTIGRTVIEDFQYSFAAIEKKLPYPGLLRKYGLYDIRDRETQVLSGGEQHRLNCASVLELGHIFIIADFSYSNLDQDFLQEVLGLLHEKANQGSALLIHGLPPPLKPSRTNRTFVISNGNLTESNPDPSLFPNPDAALQQLSQLFQKRSESSTAVLKVHNLVGRRGVTRPISFEIHEREVVRIWGPNGCGKTTLAKILVNTIREDAGSYQLANGVFPALCFQNPERLFIESSIWKELPDCNELSSIGIPEAQWSAHPRSLSRSKQKLLGTLLAFKRSSQFAILDEPTSGLDFPSKLKFVEILNRHPNHTVLIITHDPALDSIGRRIRWEDITS